MTKRPKIKAWPKWIQVCYTPINKLKTIRYDTVNYDCFVSLFRDKYDCIAGAEEQVCKVQQTAIKKWFDWQRNCGKNAP